MKDDELNVELEMRSKIMGIITKLRTAAVGTIMGAAMCLPTTALGWDYSNVPLFWVQGIKPNVALMIDDSGSMKAMTTNEAFQRANLTGSLPSTEWYWCTEYTNSSKQCTKSSGRVAGGFNVLAWEKPAVGSKSFTITKSWKRVGDDWRDSDYLAKGCGSSDSGFFKTSSGTSTTTTYSAHGICNANHGFEEGDIFTYTGASTGGLTATTTYYLKDVSQHGFRLATSPSNSATSFNVRLSNSGNFTYTISKALPSYIASREVALCNVNKQPGDADFYIGNSGRATTTAPAQLPSSNQVGVLVTNRDGGSGTMDSCVRWKMSSTARIKDTSDPEGWDYERYSSGTVYNMDSNVPYGNFLLNTLVGAKASYNFDNNTKYPDADTNDTARGWDTLKDKAVKDGGTAGDNKYFIIPSATRAQAAREATQKVVAEFFDKLNIGLFHLNTNPRLIYAIPDGTDAVGMKTALIGASEGLSPADLPGSAIDGHIGNSGANGGTPLAATQTTINDYFNGGNSPVEYRCQKNFAVILTDGESSDSGFDTNTQTGYDRDLKTSGTDKDGMSWNDASHDELADPNSEKSWRLQRIVTYTIGLGLENNLLKRAPLVNKVKVANSSIADSIIKLANHKLSTGDYVQVISDAPSGLTNGSYYYAVVIDSERFKLAAANIEVEERYCTRYRNDGTCRDWGERTVLNPGDTDSSTANTRYSVDQCLAGKTINANGAGCAVIGSGAGEMVLSTGPGKSFFSFTPDQLAQDMGKVFNNINNLTASASSVSTNTKQFSGDTGQKALVYQARFNTEDWSGEVVAYPIVESNGKVTVNTAKDARTEWTTKNTLNKAADRKVDKMFMWTPSAGEVKALTADNMDTLQINALGGSESAAKVVSWLQGNNVDGLRSHSSNGLLGDIINSDPVFVSYLDQGYNRLPADSGTGADSYAAYVEQSKNRKAMIYVGANDGMLHALDAMTGKEEMTFLPNAVFMDNGEQKLLNLTDPNYDHRYYVDGSLTVGDAYLGTGWNTYLVGGLGRGGKSVFALDVTDANYSASTIKWEFSHDELGYSYGAPVIARLANNNWYAIFGNGLDSVSNKASVFMVNLANPADVRHLTTSEGSGTNKNGMMSVQVRLNSQRTVTDIYAGDMYGNIWKFDVYNENGTPNDLADDSANTSPSAVKLFQAASGQVITGGIRVGNHPDGLGALVFFGTGKYFETVDNIFNGSSVPQFDSFYAVLDDGSSANLTPNQLQKQEFVMSGDNMRTSSQIKTSYSGVGKSMGWYIDLLNGSEKRGERVVSTPVLYGGRVIFTSIVPLSGGTCGGEGTSWLNELDALTGSMLPDRVLDTNNDGVIDSKDAQVSSYELDGLASDPSVILGQKDDYKVIGSTSTNASVQVVGETKPKGAGGNDDGRKGRMSWKQLQ